MGFQSTITNEQTAELNSAHFDGEIIVVTREAQIEAAYKDLAAQKIIGFDTETRPSFKAGVTNKVSLLQLSTHKRCYLIRLCRTKLHPLILKILSNAEIKKIGADVAGDIRSLHELRNFKERGFIDLQQMVQYWGIEEKSLRKMSALVLGERVSKAQRLSNWEANTLTPQQQMYAATDAWVCIAIYEKLMATQPLRPLPDERAKSKENSKFTAASKREQRCLHTMPSRSSEKPPLRWIKIQNSKFSHSTISDDNSNEQALKEDSNKPERPYRGKRFHRHTKPSSEITTQHKSE